MTLQEPPEDVRDRKIKSDPMLGPEEKETTVAFPNDKDFGTIYSDVPTTIKWVLSIEAAEINGVRLADSGAIMAVKATIPKGIVKLQGKARKSNSHSQMVSYGDMRE